MSRRLLASVALSALLVASPASAQFGPKGGGGGGSGGSGTTTINGVACILNNSCTVGVAVGSVTGFGSNVLPALQAALNASGGIVSPTPTRAGDIVYWNGSAWVTLAGNNSGSQVLTESASGVPSWAAAGGGSGTITSVAQTCPVTTTSSGGATVDNGVHSVAKAAAYTALAADCGRLLEITGGIPIALNAASTYGSGYNLGLQNNDATRSSTVTAASGSITSGGVSAASITLGPGQSTLVVVNAAVSGFDASAGPPGATGATGPSTPVGPGYQAGPFYVPFLEPPQATAAAATATTLAYCSPVWFPSVSPTGGGSGTLAQLYIRPSALGTTNVWAAIYANDPTANPYRPGALVASTPQIPNTSTAPFAGLLPFAGGTGTPSVSANTLYWACLQVGDLAMSYFTVAFAGGGPMTSFVGAASVNNSGNGASISSGVSFAVGAFGTAWPSTAHGLSFIDTASGRPPWFGFQFASVP